MIYYDNNSHYNQVNLLVRFIINNDKQTTQIIYMLSFITQHIPNLYNNKILEFIWLERHL